MPQEQVGLKKIQSIGIVAAFGLITMSSNIAGQSSTTMSVNFDYYYETSNFSLTDSAVCNSSMLSKQAVGDIVLAGKRTDFVQQHEKIRVKLQMTKIRKHVSVFDFEEEYEEI